MTLMSCIFPTHGQWFITLSSGLTMCRELLRMGSYMIPPLGFPFIWMLADRVSNIFLLYGQVPPHMKSAGSLCFYMTPANTVWVVLPSPSFGIYFFICWWKCSKSRSCSKNAGHFTYRIMEINDNRAVQSDHRIADVKLLEENYYFS